MYLTQRQRERRSRQLQEFEVFNKAFTRSRQVRRALKDGYLSVKHPEKSLQSIRNDELIKIRQAEQKVRADQVAGVPPELLELTSFQESDGKWPVNNERIKEILGSGHGIPDPPDGITHWKWTLALCVVYLRRHSEHFDHIFQAHEKAMFYLSDPVLLDKAKDMLPPPGLDLKLDADMVRHGLWREAVDQILHTRGHEAFIKRRPDTPDEDFIARQRAEEEALIEDKRRKLLTKPPRMNNTQVQSMFFRANTLRDMGMSKFKISQSPDFKLGSHTAILNAAAPLQDALPIYSELADRLQAEYEDDLEEFLHQESAAPEAEHKKKLENTNIEHSSYGRPKNTNEPPPPQRQESNSSICTYEEYSQSTPGIADKPSGQQNKHFVEKEVEIIDGVNVGNPLDKANEYVRESLQELVAKGSYSMDDLIDGLVHHEMKLGKELYNLRTQNRLTAPEAAEALQSRWKTPLKPAAESRRLEKVTGPAPKPQWVTTKPQRSRLEPHHRKRPSRKSHNRQPPSNEYDVRYSDEERQIPNSREAPANETLSEKLRRERLQDQVDRKLQTTIKRVILYTKLHESLRQVVTDNTHAYRTVSTHAARNHAYDQTTKLIFELRLATCSLVEGITQWRQARNDLAASNNPDHHPKTYPFIWGGGNVLVRMLTHLDYLDEIPELHQWYGDLMPLRMNPFIIAVPIENRPVTPRQATRRVLVDGKPVLRVSEKLAALRAEEVEKMDKAWKIVSSGPSWWPRCSKDEWIRVRAAEKIILQEIDIHTSLRTKICS